MFAHRPSADERSFKTARSTREYHVSHTAGANPPRKYVLTASAVNGVATIADDDDDDDDEPAGVHGSTRA
jgi:hypothetical protein